MQKLELFDETFDPDRSESYELSIQVSLDGFSFCVKDLVRNFFIALGTCPFELALVSSNDWANQVHYMTNSYSWFSNNFKKVLFSFESPSFVLAPQKYFEPDKAKQILNLSHKIDDLDEIWFSNNNGETVSIFNIPSMLISNWLKVQSNTTVVSFCDSTLQFHQQFIKEGTVPALSISLANKFMVIVVSKGSKILHCGSISYHSMDETLYHMVNICNHLDLEPADTTVRTIGFTNNHETFESLIDRFFKSVTNVNSLDQNHFSYLLNKYKGRFANLFNQSLCG